MHAKVSVLGASMVIVGPIRVNQQDDVFAVLSSNKNITTFVLHATEILEVFALSAEFVTYPARRGYISAVWAVERKVASADNRSIFYRACAKFVTRFASKIVRSVVKWREFRGNKKWGNSDLLRKTHAQCSKRVINMKNPFLFICPDFWTDFNASWQRLYFARQLTQRKCSLYPQGICYINHYWQNPTMYFIKWESRIRSAKFSYLRHKHNLV